MKPFVLSCLLVFFGLVLFAFGQQPVGKAKAPGVRELADLLDETIDVEDFRQAMPLEKALALLQAKLKSCGKELPVRIDRQAFEEENPDAEKVTDTEIRFPAVPRQMKLARALRFLVRQVKTNNGTYLVRPGLLEITTIYRASLESLLSQRVHVRLQRRPLTLALDDIYELTGVAVILDTRAGRLAQMPITANFTNNATVGTVLVLLSEMAGLKLVQGDNTLYITTPAHARQFLLERNLNPYQLPLNGPDPDRPRRVEAALK